MSSLLRTLNRRNGRIRNAFAYGLLLTAIGIGILATLRAWHHPTDPWTVRLWLAAAVMLPLAGYLFRPLPTSPSPPYPHPTGRERLLALIIVLVGVGLRVYWLDTIPPGIFVDETNAAGDALRILDGWRASPFGVGWFETPLGYVYYLAGLIKLLGPTYYTLKLASLIPAVLILVAFYPLARELFGPRVALVALAFLAFNRWHMTMSRWGWNEVAPPFFHVLTVYFLLRGSRTRRLGDFATAGAVMGLGMYTYLASRLVVLAVLAYLGYRVAIERGFVRRTWQGILLFLVTYLLVFGPLATTYARDPFTFLNRSRQVSILNDMKAQYTPQNAPPEIVQKVLEKAGLPTRITFAPLMESLKRHLRMFHFEGDYNPRHNIPGAPMLDRVTGVLFALGVLYALWRWRDHRYGLLLLWVAVTLLGGIFTLVREAPQAYRTLGVVPAVCLLAGDMLVRLADALARGARWITAKANPNITSPLVRWLPPAFMAVVLAGAGLANVNAFFHRWATAQSTYFGFSPMETAVAREVKAKLATHDIYLSPTLYWGSPLRYLTYRPASEGYGLQNPPFHPIQPVEDLPLVQDVGENALFLLEPLYADLIELFTDYYPHTRVELVTSPYGNPLYLRVTIPREDLEAIRGLSVIYEGNDGYRVERREPHLQRDWLQDANVDLTRVERVTWLGSLFVPRTDVYDLRGEGALTIRVDGVLWTGPRVLGKGLHALHVTQDRPGEQRRERAVLYWQRGREGEAPVPAKYFFTVPPPDKGLLGAYFEGEGWQGPPRFTRVDRALLMAWIDPEPMMGPFSVTWTGVLWAPQEGMYYFRLDSDDGARLWLDGKVVGESLRPDTVNQIQAEIPLSAGPHSIRVDYFQRGGAKTLTLRWRPPGGQETVIPPAFLRLTP